MLNERDGGIGALAFSLRNVMTGYDTKKGVGVLRLNKKQESCRKLSVFDRNYTPVDPQSCGRQDTTFVNGLWAVSLRRRQRLSVDFQSASHLLGRRVGICETCSRGRGRLRQTKGKDDRPRSSRRTLRQGADPAPASARPRLRLHAQALSGCRLADAKPDLGCGSRSGATGQTGSTCRAGGR